MVITTGFMMHNLCEGMVWFLLPCTLVIANDIFAYIFGFFFGTHKLIQLSPKKTWEGFIGGAASSFFVAFVLSTLATYIPALICPQRSFSILPFEYESC
jgi:phosphatidate cytidylyltransferase